jgi:hypothetical protein
MSAERLSSETVRRVINLMVQDVVQEAERRLAALEPRSAEDIRAAGRPMVVFSAPMQEANQFGHASKRAVGIAFIEFHFLPYLRKFSDIFIVDCGKVSHGKPQ